MNLVALTPVLIRVAALFGLVDATGSVTYAAKWLIDPPRDTPAAEIIVIFGSLAVKVLLFVLLFAFAKEIGRFVFKSDSSSMNRSPAGDRLEGAALFFLGCYLMAYAVIDATNLVGKLYLYFNYSALRGGPRVPTPIQPEDYARMWSTAVKFVLACGFIVFSRGIVALKDRILSLREFPPPP
jgi:hypothetical protein